MQAAGIDLKGNISDSLRYWELHRLYYNLWLIGLTLGCCAFLPDIGRWLLTGRGSGMLVVLATLANLCYCSAYPLDLLIQCSDYRDSWRRWRWLLFVAGSLLAALLTLMSLPWMTSHGKFGF